MSDVKKELAELVSKHDNLEIIDAAYDGNGKLSARVRLKTNVPVTNLPEGVELVGTEDNLRGVHLPAREFAGSPTVINRDILTRDYLDLADQSYLNMEPQQVYQQAIDYYRTKGVYGSIVDILSNFASKGFENDIDDQNIKNFFDNWVVDTGFDKIVEQIFFDLIRVGMVRTYRLDGKYEPKLTHISSLPGEKAKRPSKKFDKEFAAKKDKFSKDYLPLAYTILNPVHIRIKGSMMFGKTATYLSSEAGEELRKILKIEKEEPEKLSDFDRSLLKSIPPSWKKAALSNQDIPLEGNKLGEIDYRRMPYERYPYPRGARAFDYVDFNDELRKADLSTIDGVSHYILKITVGNDQLPVKNQETLENVARMFDTVSKSYKVVWNHTLNVEKITSSEIADILGKDKYVQNNEDITGALAFPRTLVDGLAGDSAGLEWAIRSTMEEIQYLRTQVKRWIYEQYRLVSAAMGFDRYPKVRFDDMALRDELAMMTIVQGMVDRRIISYHTGQKKLGFDPSSELAQMQRERPLVEAGDLGILGSPYQKSAQSEQRTPEGTPSEGRPRGRPAKTPEAKDTTAPPKPKKKQILDTTKAALDLDSLTIEDLELILEQKKNLVNPKKS